MIDSALIKRLLVIAAVLVCIAGGIALILGGGLSFAGGIALGAALGAVPFASWAWIAARGFATRRNRILAALLVLAKLALYSGVLYLLVTRETVNPIGVMIGITAVVGTFSVGSLIGGAPRPKEAS